MEKARHEENLARLRANSEPLTYSFEFRKADEAKPCAGRIIEPLTNHETTP